MAGGGRNTIPFGGIRPVLLQHFLAPGRLPPLAVLIEELSHGTIFCR